MRLGICIHPDKYYNNELFDVELPGRGSWTHCSVQHCSWLTEEDFDFDEDHIVDYLLEHRYSWGTYLPEEILIKLRDKIDRNDEWLISEFNWLVHQVNYNRNFPKKVDII